MAQGRDKEDLDQPLENEGGEMGIPCGRTSLGRVRVHGGGE